MLRARIVFLLFVCCFCRKYLPTGPLIVAYQDWSACDEVQTLKVVEKGVNVVIWFALNLARNATTGLPLLQGGPNTSCVSRVRSSIETRHLPTAHLISIGGWDAPHPDTSFSGLEWFQAWHRWNSALPRPFDGFDWDLEGNDDFASKNNEFTPEVLRLVVEMSEAAKEAGYIVTMVPAQSYLDVTSSHFNRSLRNAYPEWHPEFHYHGLNCYAYLLHAAREGTFDLVMVQVYETYSRAEEALVRGGQSGAEYLKSWISAVLKGWNVHFDDPLLPSRGLKMVRVRPEQFVVAFSFGSADGKSPYFSPADARSAYLALNPSQRPRGFGFWNIALDGTEVNGTSVNVSFAAELNTFLHVRESASEAFVVI